MRENRVEIGSYSVRFIHMGDSPTKVVMLPGWPYPSDIFRLLEDCIDGYEIISFDFPYWAGRTCCTGEFAGGFDEYRHFVLATLSYLRQTIGKFYLGGVSVGGLLAILSYQELGDCVRGCFVQSPALNGAQIASAHPRELKAMSFGVKIPLFGTFLKWFYLASYLLISQKTTTHVSKGIKTSIYKGFKTMDARCVLCFAFDFFTNQYLTVPVHRPVTVLGCTQDTAVKIDDLKINIRMYLKSCSLIEVVGKHYFLLQDPEQFSIQLKNFLSRN